MTTQSMNHQQALETMAAERYLLREMKPDERRAFEEHYLECAECLEAVTFGSDFMEAGHAVAMEQQSARTAAAVPTWRERMLSVFGPWLRPAPALAFALLLCVAGYQGFRISQLENRAEVKVASAEYRFTLTGIAHGAGDARLIQVPRDAVVSLGVEYNRSGEYVGYRAQILAADGKVKQSIAVPDLPGNMATVALNPASLPDGEYSLVILGKTADGNENEVGKGNFRLQIAR